MLGGGQNGHLGLLPSGARHTALAHALPWVTPGDDPALFMPPAAGTGPQIEAARDTWKELKPMFEICQATKALVAQIVETIDPICLQALLNHATGQHSTSIRAPLQRLFNARGKITPEQVKPKKWNCGTCIAMSPSQLTLFSTASTISQNSPITQIPQ
jgi:hypothetical protein